MERLRLHEQVLGVEVAADALIHQVVCWHVHRLVAGGTQPDLDVASQRAAAVVVGALPDHVADRLPGVANDRAALRVHPAAVLRHDIRMPRSFLIIRTTSHGSIAKTANHIVVEVGQLLLVHRIPEVTSQCIRPNRHP